MPYNDKYLLILEIMIKKCQQKATRCNSQIKGAYLYSIETIILFGPRTWN